MSSDDISLLVDCQDWLSKQILWAPECSKNRSLTISYCFRNSLQAPKLLSSHYGLFPSNIVLIYLLSRVEWGIFEPQDSLTTMAVAPHSSTLAWKIPWTEEPGGLQSLGSLRVGHDWATSLSLFTFMHEEGNGNPLQCSCLENPRDGEPDGLPSMRLHRVGHNWSDLAAAAWVSWFWNFFLKWYEKFHEYREVNFS